MLAQLALAIVSVIFIHLLAIAACARVLGIAIRTVTLGIGPQVLAIGRLRLALFPNGGNIRLAMLADAPEGEPVAGALDLAAHWERILLSLSGPLACSCSARRRSPTSP
ncbi:site-2 protease family protein [Massilia glaciei]|uniref:site-2 protease family protein n=1 Tax=Massilia glaciei TaxID=1524097 RepID=UPI001C636CE3